MVVSATQLVDAAAIVHPAFIEVSDADKVATPLFLIDTKDEDKDTMDKFTEALKKKPFGEKVERKRFDDTFHGFCAGRANYGDEKNAKYANEVCFAKNAINIRPTLTLQPSSRKTCLELTEMYTADRNNTVGYILASEEVFPYYYSQATYLNPLVSNTYPATSHPDQISR